MLPFNSKDIKEFVNNWNKAIPIDKWYRKKYNIPFNSLAHRQVNLIDMFCEFWEFISIDFESKNIKKEKQESYVKGKGNFMKEIEFSTKDIDDLFDQIDIDNID